MIYGIQSLFQSLNIEVQDVSPDVASVMASIAAAQTLTTFVISPDKPYVKNNRYLFPLHFY
ncbi:conserved protein of unknown function [Citrobacter freundii]|nr:conserved protein of unknown function [Citrobacter freundii]